MPALGGISPVGSVALGIIVGLLSTAIQSVGLTLQRKSHLEEDSKEDGILRRPPYRRRRWQIGMLMFILSNIVGSSIQITTLPLPVLSTLQASGLVFNTGCASLLLGEPFTRWSFFGTLLVAAGAILIALFGAVAESSHSLSELLLLLERQQFILWMVGTFVVMLVILGIALVLGRLQPEHSPRLRFWRGMCFGTISGILSAHSLLVAKSAVELIVKTVTSRENQFNRWQSWVIVLMLLFFALTQLYFLHRGLKLCSTSVLYPFVFCMYNIIAILDGLIYFKQTSRLPALHAGLIALGTVILLAGVLALSWRLEDDGTIPPVDAGTFLTPSMGIVEDTTTESSSDGLDSDDDYDDDAAVLPATERTPLLNPTISNTSQTMQKGSLHFSKPRQQKRTTINNYKNFHRQRHRSGSANLENVWSELQDEEDEAATGFTTSPRKRIKRTNTDPLVNNVPSDADDDSLPPTPSSSHLTPPFGRSSISKSKPAAASTRHHRAHTLAGTGINAIAGIDPNTSAYARQLRDQQRRTKRRRWSSRYRSASLAESKIGRAGHDADIESGTRPHLSQRTSSAGDGFAGTRGGTDAEEGQGGVAGWISWLLGKSTRRKKVVASEDREETHQPLLGSRPEP